MAVAADLAIDIELGTAGLFSAAGHEHWVTAPLAEGSFNNGESPYVAYTVHARKMRLLEDKKLNAEQHGEVQRTMQTKVLQSEIYPLISFHSTKGEKNGVNRWIVYGELTLHGQSRPILAGVHDSAESHIGHSKIKQTDFGINPVSIAGLLLRGVRSLAAAELGDASRPRAIDPRAAAVCLTSPTFSRCPRSLSIGRPLLTSAKARFRNFQFNRCIILQVPLLPGDPTMETTETLERELRRGSKNSAFRFWNTQRVLTAGSFGMAVVQGVCAMAVFVSGISTALGFSTLIAATAAGPATGFHAHKFRIPMLALAGAGALINLFLFWNAERMRRNPAARWRQRPLTRRERLEKRIQLSTSILTLLLIAGELLAHPLFHHEL